MKVRSGVWFAMGVVLVLLAFFFGSELYFRYAIAPLKYPRLQPKAVNLIGVAIPGYRIIVSNGIARLQQGGTDAFGKPQDDMDASSGTIVPMRGLIGSLRFESGAASELVTALSGIKYEIEPDSSLTWEADNILRAIGGDQQMKARLERDLCTRLDGSPADAISWARIESGIWIRLPVEVSVPSAEGAQRVRAFVTVPFKTRLAETTGSRIRPRLTGGRLEPDAPMLKGTYEDVARTIPKENVENALRAAVSKERAKKLAEPAEKLLQGIVVLATDAEMTGGSIATEPDPDGNGTLTTLLLEVTQDARNRLWQYTHDRVGSQLLLVWNDVAIAAPVIRHEIKYSKVAITNIADEELARGPLDYILRTAKPK